MPIDGSGNYTRTNGNYSGSNLWQQRAANPAPLNKIDAAEHDAEMNDIASAISGCLKANGSKVPTANLPMSNFKHTGCANAINSDEYATLGQIGALVPVGVMLPYGGSSAPTGWLLADGSAISRTSYAALYAIYGTTYGVGDGSTTFNLPDCRQRFPLGKAASGTGVTLGSTGGAIDHTHTGPSHTHTGPSHQHTLGNHTHDLNSHTHTGPSHTHSAGSYAAMIGEGYGTDNQIAMLLDGSNTFGGSGSTHPAAAIISSATLNFSLVGSPSYNYPSTVVYGTSAASGTGATGGPSVANTTAPSADITGIGGTGLTGASGTGNTGTGNPPYLVVNYIIKY